MVHFTINRLGDSPIIFDFDLNASLKEFREKIGDVNPSYTLLSDRKAHIYENDPSDESLKNLFEKYSPELLNKDEIIFFFVFNIGVHRKRTGARLLSHDMVKPMEESNDTYILVCPITQDFITNAVKLNNRWYELSALAEYLNNQYKSYRTEHQFLDGQHFRMTCPLRVEIPDEMVLSIKSSHENPPLESSRASMEYVLHHRNEFASDQLEYGKLLLERESTLKRKVATVSNSEESYLPQDVTSRPSPVLIPRQPKRIRTTEEAELRREAESFIGNDLPSKRRRPN